MANVVSRTFCSSPKRDASETWREIVDVLTKEKSSIARNELLAIAGVASSLISDQCPKDAPIVITCDGPRTRIYCLFGDDAIEGTDANEELISHDPLAGDWKMSLPCSKDDLTWVQSALKNHSNRITARDLETTVESEQSQNRTQTTSLTVDLKGFLGS
jgi:hypothetical protein